MALDNAYRQLVRELEARKCLVCRGLGECDDLEPGDIYCNKWTCTACNGSGLNDTGSPHPHPIQKMIDSMSSLSTEELAIIHDNLDKLLS